MFRRLLELVAPLSIITLVCVSCGVGERPTLDSSPTVIGLMTGEPAIDQVLTRLDKVASAVFTADYTAILAYGSTASTVAVTQDGTDNTAVRRSVTIGDVRYINTPDRTSTCSVESAQCSTGIDASKVSDTGVTPDFAFGDMAKRLRRDATARIDTPTASTKEVAGATATCVDLPVTGGTKEYCVFDDGVLARYVGGDLTIDVDKYDKKVDELLFLV